MKFPDKVPQSLVEVLQAYKRGQASSTTAQNEHQSGKGKSGTGSGKGKKATKALAATVAEELIRRGVIGHNLDTSN